MIFQVNSAACLIGALSTNRCGTMRCCGGNYTYFAWLPWWGCETITYTLFFPSVFLFFFSLLTISVSGPRVRAASLFLFFRVAATYWYNAVYRFIAISLPFPAAAAAARPSAFSVFVFCGIKSIWCGFWLLPSMAGLHAAWLRGGAELKIFVCVVLCMRIPTIQHSENDRFLLQMIDPLAGKLLYHQWNGCLLAVGLTRRSLWACASRQLTYGRAACLAVRLSRAKRIDIKRTHPTAVVVKAVWWAMDWNQACASYKNIILRRRRKRGILSCLYKKIGDHLLHTIWSRAWEKDRRA